MEQLLRHSKAGYVSLMDATCPRKVCPTLDRDGNPMMFDASHYTTEGAFEVLTALRARGFLANFLAQNRGGKPSSNGPGNGGNEALTQQN
jgi:hypothetical protein